MSVLRWSVSLFSPYKNLPREVYVIFISRLINAAGAFVFPMLTLILTRKMGLTIEKAGLIISIGSLVLLPATWIGGKLADAIGRKRTIIIFDILGIIAYLICGFIAPGVVMLAFILLALVMFSCAGPAHDALIADLTSPEERSGAYALSYLGWNLGFALGPMVGGLLFENYLNWIFIGDALTAFFAVILVALFIPETHPRIASHKTQVLSEQEKAVSGSVFYVLRQRPILLVYACFMLLLSWVYVQWGFLLPDHTNTLFGENGANYYGRICSLNGLVVILFTPILTKLFERWHLLSKMALGALLYVIGFGLFSMVSELSEFLILTFVFTCGEIILVISAMPFVSTQTPESHRGRVNAVLGMITGIGAILGPVLMGIIIRYSSISSGWLVTAGIATLAGLGFLMMKKRVQRGLD